MKTLAIILLCFVVFSVCSGVVSDQIYNHATLDEMKRHYAAMEQMRSDYNKNALANSERFNKLIEDSL